ncbi:ABC transporter substrate-binding protein [[Mycobacterium] vasticus]|uniref:ABC transporter substrate-binding protein n=1 Tax=[Mycobacterium] vasticus TaxID=2875777 RepID=A0ABU5Z6V9_9MYCO|nr:ABC transporter substrate-binding protein [Mycolicibacter sp. MYC017]MEB3071683.1 ABC transporter substrate-binding protein [Mycolicibacter sp. MYC017]
MTDAPPDRRDEERLTKRSRAPHKIGVCLEFAGGTQLAQDFLDGIRLALDEAVGRGEIDRDVELVVREVQGPMRGTSAPVIRAWRELVHDEDCLAVLGPVVTEANLALCDEVNATGVPTISFCATADWAGPYCYALQNGNYPDEAHVLAGWLAREGCESVAVFRETGLIGEEFGTAFKVAARRCGLRVTVDHEVGLFNTYTPVEPALKTAHLAGTDAVLVLSAYGALAPVQRELARVTAEWDWHPRLAQNMTWVGLTAFGATGDFDADALGEAFEGWVGLDQIHEDNQYFQDVLDRFEARYGRRPFHAYTALGFDHGAVVAEVLAGLRLPSPAGFKAGLERIRVKSACVGAPGTVISFGPHDNRGYKGEYIVLRTVRDGVEQPLGLKWVDLLETEPETRGGEDIGASGSAVAGAGSAYALAGDREPFRIGVLQDWALWAPVEDWYGGLTLAFEEAYETGLIDRPVELVIREVEGPPEGDFAGVRRAWRELVEDEMVLATVGPFITETTRALRDDIERAKVPCLSYCATTGFDGDYTFQLPNGTFADETFLIARHLVERGVRRVGVVREDNPIGDEYYAYFRQHAQRLGLDIASDQLVSPRVDDAGMALALANIRASGADGLAHLGYGLTFYAILHSCHDIIADWDVPRCTITTWVTCSGLDQERGSPVMLNLPAPTDLLEGWVGVDLPHEGNRVWSGFLNRYTKRFGGSPPVCCYPAHLYDMGRALAEGIALARPVSPEGLRHGLEQVRMLPAAMGAPGTVIGFGPYDHRGYKGSDYLVLRTVRNGREGLVEDLL